MLALAQYLPRLAARIPTVSLGDWPTPITAVDVGGRTLWVKDEGFSNAAYGGNKIRTLEMWFGHAQQRGVRRIWAIGAYGSNHAVATVVHAHTAGLEAGAILFPQPTSEWAVENCGALIASGIPLVRVPNVALMPVAALRIARRDRNALVMPPGGATPVGTFGALGGALELAAQIGEGRVPPPNRIVVGVGSTCTISGLVAGLAVAHAIGAWRWPLPLVHGVRVTPWPITSPMLIAELVHRTLVRVERLGGPRVAIGRRELLSRFVIDGSELGQGYGRLTEHGSEAIRTLVGPRLDGVYSAKAAAGLLRLHRSGIGPLVFWASKSQAVLPPPALDTLRGSNPALLRWLRA